MKIKLTTLTTIFLFALNNIFGQINHEIKIDLVAINKHYILSYESILTKRISIEVGLGLDFQKLFLSETDFNTLNTEFYDFSATRMNTNISGKYYVTIKENGSGIYIGPYTRLKYLLSREEGYVEKWEEINNNRATERIMSNSGVRNLQYGIHSGGKLVLRNHYLIEFSIAYTLDKEIGKGAQQSTIYNTRYSIKLGYRL